MVPGSGHSLCQHLWAGKQGVQPTAWANIPRGSRPITVRDGLLQGACEAPVAFALALRVAMKEFEKEKKKKKKKKKKKTKTKTKTKT